MQLIHLSWVACADNRGHLALWLESSMAIKPSSANSKKAVYPYQCDANILEAFAQEFFKGQILKPEKLELMIPCNHEDQPIPSPLISNLCAIEDTEVSTLTPFSVNALNIHQTLSFIKDLNFASYYFDENTQLADDAKFWIAVARELSSLIKHDQYIPFIVATKKRNKVSYAAKWQPLSDEYQRFCKHLAERMPHSACNKVDADSLSVIENFSEIVLTDFVKQTTFAQKHYKQVEGTIIDDALSLKDNAAITESSWKEWKQWYNNLTYDQLGAPFKLVMRLEAPAEEDDQWYLTFLLQAKEDPSSALCDSGIS